MKKSKWLMTAISMLAFSPYAWGQTVSGGDGGNGTPPATAAAAVAGSNNAAQAVQAPVAPAQTPQPAAQPVVQTAGTTQTEAATVAATPVAAAESLDPFTPLNPTEIGRYIKNFRLSLDGNRIQAIGLIPQACVQVVRFNNPTTRAGSSALSFSFSVRRQVPASCTQALVNSCTRDSCANLDATTVANFSSLDGYSLNDSREIQLAHEDIARPQNDPNAITYQAVPASMGGPLRFTSAAEEHRIASVRDAVMREQRKTELCNQARNGDGEALTALGALLGPASARTASQRRLFDSLYERVLETRVTELERRIVAATNKEELDELITEVRTFFNEQEDQAQSNEQKTRLRRFATQLLVGSSDKPGIARRALELALEAEENTDDLDNDVLDANGRRRSGVRGNTSRAIALFRGAENAIREAMRVDPRNSTLRAQLLRVQRSRLEYAARNGTSYYTRREGQEYTRLYNNAAQCLRTVRDPDYLRECAETVRLAGPYAIQEQVWTPYGQFVGTRAGTGLDAIASRADQSALAGLYNNNGGYTSLVPAGAAGVNGAGAANNDQAIRATAAMIAAQQGQQPGALGVNQQLINAGATGVGGLPPAIPNMPGAAGTAGLFRL